MLSALTDLIATHTGRPSNGFDWYMIETAQLAEALPFWDGRDLQRVSNSLREKGVILIGSAPLQHDDNFKFAFNEKAAPAGHSRPPLSHAAAPPAEPAQQGLAHKNFISTTWRPDQVTLDQLAQLNIHQEFAMQQIPEFVTYWRERREAHRSWGQKFISHTLQRWRTHEAREQRRNMATAIPSNWQPAQASLEEIEQRKIPRQFTLDQVGEFIRYWQATGERHIAWDTKFIQRVITCWSDQESKRNVSMKEYKIFAQWQPSADALEIMTTKSEIPLSFIEDAIPEFVIYWQDKGITSNTWNSLFIKHVRLQWHRFQHALDNSVNPQPIGDQWQPSNDVFDILKLANIDREFAQSLIPEFILYWKDSNEIHRSWNTRFLRHVKKLWAERHQLSASPDNTSRSTRDITLEEELNDTSWAN